jgi:hypothetical protein
MFATALLAIRKSSELSYSFTSLNARVLFFFCGDCSSTASPVRGSPHSFDVEDVHLHLEEELSAVDRSASASAAMLAAEEEVSNHTLHQRQ